MGEIPRGVNREQEQGTGNCGVSCHALVVRGSLRSRLTMRATESSALPVLSSPSLKGEARVGVNRSGSGG
jgi:hypothetical protein